VAKRLPSLPDGADCIIIVESTEARQDNELPKDR